MVKVDSQEFRLLVSILTTNILGTNPGRSRKSQIKSDFYDYAAGLLRQELEDAIRNNLQENPEAAAFPAIIDQLVKAVLDKTSTEKSFYAFTKIEFDDETGRPYADEAPDLEWALGGYQDFIDGKMAAGGSEESDEYSAKKWFFIYRDFLSGNGKAANKYKEIMSERLAYWRAGAVAPMWYWFSEKVSTGLAYPYQKVTYLDQDICSTIDNFLYEINMKVDFSYSPREEAERYERLQAEVEREEQAERERRASYWDSYGKYDEEQEEVQIEYVPEVSLRDFVPESIGFDVTIHVSGKGGERQVSMQMLVSKLQSREWVVTKSYTAKLGGRDVIVAQIHRVTASGQREFTGHRLEYR